MSEQRIFKYLFAILQVMDAISEWRAECDKYFFKFGALKLFDYKHKLFILKYNKLNYGAVWYHTHAIHDYSYDPKETSALPQ